MTESTQVSGKVLIIGIVAMAIGAAGFAWWFQFTRGRRALAYWGGEDAAVIRHGTEAELLLLGPGGTGESLVVKGQKRRVEQRISLTGANGFIHARHALIDDASYAWDAAPSDWTWTHAIRFQGESSSDVVVAIDLQRGILAPQGARQALQMSEKLRTGLADFFGEIEQKDATSR